MLLLIIFSIKNTNFKVHLVYWLSWNSKEIENFVGWPDPDQFLKSPTHPNSTYFVIMKSIWSYQHLYRYIYKDLYRYAILATIETTQNSGNFRSFSVPFGCAPNSPMQCGFKSGVHDIYSWPGLHVVVIEWR